MINIVASCFETTTTGLLNSGSDCYRLSGVIHWTRSIIVVILVIPNVHILSRADVLLRAFVVPVQYNEYTDKHVDKLSNGEGSVQTVLISGNVWLISRTGPMLCVGIEYDFSLWVIRFVGPCNVKGFVGGKLITLEFLSLKTTKIQSGHFLGNSEQILRMIRKLLGGYGGSYNPFIVYCQI